MSSLAVHQPPAPGPAPTSVPFPASAMVPASSMAPADSSALNGSESGAKHGAEHPTGPNHVTGANGVNSETPLANAVTTATEGADLPPSQIVSDLPGIHSPTAAAPPPPAPGKFSSPSINGLSMRTLGSNGSTPRHSPLPALPSPAFNLPPPPKNRTNNSRWTDQPSYSHPYPPAIAQTPLSTPVKIPIVDAAPGIGTPSPAPTATSGFPSPGKESLHQNSKFKDDRTRITYSIRQALPDAARRSVRDNWEKCLLGSDFHQAFVLNASIHHATPAAIQRGIRDFGKTMVGAAKAEILDHLTPADLDQLADQILAKASDRLLDMALDRRFRTIEAKKLINALARAERLGYEPGDVDEEADLAPDQHQHQHQQHHQSASGHAYAQIRQQQNDDSATASSIAAGAHTAPTPAPVPAPGPTLPRHCGICFRRFSAQSAYDYHAKGKVCTRSPSSPGGFKYNCQHCGQGFTTVIGLQYHNANKVCGDFGESPKVKPAPTMPSLATPAAQRVAATPLPMTPSAPVVKPTSYSPAPSSSAPAYGTPGLTQHDGSIADPYAHLSPELLAAMQEELREAEIKFSERMRQASLIPDESERKARLDALANSFGTKQSLIRKKYGVRLRMRRTRAEIQAERDRMQYKTAAELQADLGVANNGPGRPVASSYRPSPEAGGRPRSRNGPGAQGGGLGSGWATVNQPPTASTTLASSLSIPQPRIKASGEVGMHGGKRRFSRAEEGLPQNKRIAYSEMGGLGGAAGVDAETTDPTMRSEATNSNNSTGLKGSGTPADPMALDDSDSDSGEDSGDEDIPNHLPASVRQSLQRSSSAAAPGGSRPGSSSK